MTLLDRTNHFLFQPLLYQVATSILAPDEVAVPLRRELRRFGNIEVLLTCIRMAARDTNLYTFRRPDRAARQH